MRKYPDPYKVNDESRVYYKTNESLINYVGNAHLQLKPRVTIKTKNDKMHTKEYIS